MTAWHGGKGGTPRKSSISKEMLNLRDALWRAPENEKAAILSRIKELEQEENLPKQKAR